MGELGEIIGSDGDRGRFNVALPAPFAEPQRHQVEWTNYLTPRALIDLVASRSYCITSRTEVRTRTLDQVRELAATHPVLAHSSGLAMPYVTVCIPATLAKRLPLVFVVAEEFFGVVEGVVAGLAVVQIRWGDPCGVAVGVFAGGPALFREFVMRSAGQRQVVDVGGGALGVGGDVVDFGEVAGNVAAGMRAAAILGMDVSAVHPTSERRPTSYRRRPQGTGIPALKK